MRNASALGIKNKKIPQYESGEDNFAYGYTYYTDRNGCDMDIAFRIRIYSLVPRKRHNDSFPRPNFSDGVFFRRLGKMFGGNPANYADNKFDWINFPRWFGNTLLIACCSCVLTTLMTLATSYAFSRMRFRMRQPYMKLILILGMFPGFLGMIAIYNILRAFGLNEGPLKIIALIFVYSAGAGMGYYVCKGFFDTIPKGLDEAAKLDGANQAQIFFKITLPLSKPIIVYTALTAFMAPWMDFIFRKTYLLG